MLLSDFQLPPFIEAHLRWYLAAAILVVGLLMAGIGDLARFSFTRIWAISGVCFQESIRRRVLWITPLAIAGVIVAVQLLNPLDAQDAIRQTIKYSLFATGTLVVLVTIIMACTSLPKEIDNRVIFTIVTKPVTRLEIVLGKIVGFGRVSALLLGIMGLFTMGYAQIRASHLRADARGRIESLNVNDPSRPTLEHYAKFGLLQSKAYAWPVDFQQFARVPMPQDTVRWMSGNDEEGALVGFDLPAEMFPEADAATGTTPDNGGLIVQGHIQYEFHEGHQDWHPTPFPGDLPNPAVFKGLSLKERGRPAVSLDILGSDKFNLIPTAELPNGGNVLLSTSKEGVQDLLQIKSRPLDRLYQIPQEHRRIFVKVTGSGPIRYGIGRDSLRLFSPRLKSLGKSGIIDPLMESDGKIAWPVFRGRELQGAQQLRGGADLQKVATGVFAFRNTHPPSGSATVPIELRVGIEGSGEEVSALEAITRAVVQIVNKQTGQVTPTIEFPIESNRTAFFNVPVDALTGGDFDVQLRCLGPGHYLIIRGATAQRTLQLVTANEPFAFNLFKSLLVMWLMSVLVVMVAIFCSTFVSWPIAVVLTVVILLAHWGAQQIADSSGPGAGAQIMKDFFPSNSDPARLKAFTSAIDGLTRLLNIVSKVLPDISQFSATEDIERGVSIAPRVLLESIKVIAAFGLPLTVLAYVFLKRKEVAP